MVSFRIFSLILLLAKAHYTYADSCDSELNKRDITEVPVNRPDVTEHLGPVTIASLNLSRFFDCLRSNTNLTSTVGYVPGVASINVNVSMSELGNYNQTLLDTCCDTNSYGLTQFDYLVFREGWEDDYVSIDRSETDNTIVRSNIVGEIGGANLQVNSELRPTNITSDSTWLMKRGTDMVINFESSTYQEATVCNVFTGVCVNRCKATNAVGMSTTRSGLNYTGAYSHHQCTFKGRDDYKQIAGVHHKNTVYWAYGGATMRIE
ncbi:K7_11205p [Saccharomyces cerevisiae Kyokai no. 7]|uniref:K7_11205p n=1 Tax=Saccharomyces cerevisiae (strain Kyokai no. 7 / NBRC 101557) TaxID=721032 RepID=G2WHG8_YEASK|nr:K7_11205p [Saccharomyces cerevisiae Kyokai no. 7]